MLSTKTRIGGVPEHFNLPWERAIEHLADSGQDVSWRAFPDGSGAMAKALEADELDVAVMLTASTLKAMAGGLPIRIIGTHVPSPLRWGIHVAALSTLRSPDDLRGQRIAISRQGSGSHLIPIVDALIRGWPVEDMTFVEVGTIVGAREALSNGHADVFFWEQFMTQPLVDRGVFRRLGVRLPPWPSFLVVARESWIERVDDPTSLLANVDLRCQSLALDENTASLISSRFHMSAEQATEWLGLTDWRTLPSVSIDALTKASHYLKTALGLKLPDVTAMVGPHCELTDQGQLPL